MHRNYSTGSDQPIDPALCQALAERVEQGRAFSAHVWPGRTVPKSWLINEGREMGEEDKAKSSITMENGTYLGHRTKSRGEHSELTERIY